MSDAEYVEFVWVAWQRHLRLAVLLTGDRLHAEELLQDCLVKMYVCWPTGRTWTRTCAGR